MFSSLSRAVCVMLSLAVRFFDGWSFRCFGAMLRQTLLKVEWCGFYVMLQEQTHNQYYIIFAADIQAALQRGNLNQTWTELTQQRTATQLHTSQCFSLVCITDNSSHAANGRNLVNVSTIYWWAKGTEVNMCKVWRMWWERKKRPEQHERKSVRVRAKASGWIGLSRIERKWIERGYSPRGYVACMLQWEGGMANVCAPGCRLTETFIHFNLE